MELNSKRDSFCREIIWDIWCWCVGYYTKEWWRIYGNWMPTEHQTIDLLAWMLYLYPSLISISDSSISWEISYLTLRYPPWWAFCWTNIIQFPNGKIRSKIQLTPIYPAFLGPSQPKKESQNYSNYLLGRINEARWFFPLIKHIAEVMKRKIIQILFRLLL